MTETGHNKEMEAAMLSVLLGGLESCRRALRENASDGIAETPPLLDDWREMLSRCCDSDLIGSPTVAQLIRSAERLAAGGEITNGAVPRQLGPVFDNIELESRHKPGPRRYGMRP